MFEKKKQATLSTDEIDKLQAELAAAAANLSVLPPLESLTNLPDKTEFEESVVYAMERTQRSRQLMAVVFIDINHTKLLLAKLGAPGKNALNLEFVMRVKATVRDDDVLARLAFDRYALVMEKVSSVRQVRVVISRILGCIDRGFFIDGHDVTITTNIGVAFYAGGEETPTEICGFAETALFKAKATQHSAYEIAGNITTDDV